MNGIGPMIGMHGVLALRNQILERSQSLQNLHLPVSQAGSQLGIGRDPTEGRGPAAISGFGKTLSDALESVNAMQSESSEKAAAWERGETHDIASVMLSRQKASIAFEATLQVRNRLLSAYRDIMNMPV